MPKFACVTDYQKNYSTGYFGHAPGSTSFNDAAIPGLIAEICGAGRGVVDLGGGNGALRDRLATFGIRCLTVDPGAATGEDFITADLSIADQDAVERLRDDIRSRLGRPYLATCLDVAEHIDIEHVADFVFNLRTVVDTEIVLSVSTRPSSQGNRYHSCVLPSRPGRRSCPCAASRSPAWTASTRPGPRTSSGAAPRTWSRSRTGSGATRSGITSRISIIFCCVPDLANRCPDRCSRRS